MKTLSLPQQTAFYRGKVRDVYSIADKWLVMLASDRISAFDVILPEPIPYKGQVLNQIAARMLEASKGICKNWLLSSPAPNVSIGLKCEPFKLEMVVRGNLTGHAWRTYQTGARVLCGVPLPDGMKENDFFPTPIITPSTKASEGHDEDISAEQILASGLCTAAEWEVLCSYALALFKLGGKLAEDRQLILADTKYEFGKYNGEIYLMDEIHTPDSSRYFLRDGFAERQQNAEKQKQLSKEFVREWLIANNFMGKEGQTVPPMSPEWISAISGRYIELFEKVTGEKFVPITLSDAATTDLIVKSLKELGAV